MSGKDPETGQFLPGNLFWMNRTKHGPDRLMSDAATLQEACCEYFVWATETPLKETKIGWYEGDASEHEIGRMRPFTVRGLCIYLGISQKTWFTWRESPDLGAVCEWVDEVIKEQKFAGAVAGLMNASIIARDLGLADKKDVDVKSSDGSMSPTRFDDTVEQVMSAIKEIDKG